MKQGGGIGLMFRSDLKVKTLEVGCRNTFEYSVWQIRLKDKDQKDQTFEILAVHHQRTTNILFSHLLMTSWNYTWG